MRLHRGWVVPAAFAAVALSGCAKQVEAPTDRGVCWHVVQLPSGQMRFNKVSSGEPSIESCAASLEAMRDRFLSIGGSNLEITGAYQGNFLFLSEQGIFTSQELTGPRYFLLGRTADGRLATASALSTGQ
jgi:hypothetical protein